jgi:hypothetical protein
VKRNNRVNSENLKTKSPPLRKTAAKSQTHDEKVSARSSVSQDAAQILDQDVPKRRSLNFDSADEVTDCEESDHSSDEMFQPSPAKRSRPNGPKKQPGQLRSALKVPDTEMETSLSYDLYDENVLPATQKQHRLKTPKQTKSPARKQAAAGSRSVSRGENGRRRSGKRPILPLNKKMRNGSGEVSLWDVAIAKNRNFAHWIQEREKLDQQLDQAELSVTLDQTFPDMNMTI